MTSDTDLLGDPLISGSLVGQGRSGKGKQWGYARPPGTGPAGETCGSCRHIVRNPRYRKCGLARARWTHGFKSDILARSPACLLWETAAHWNVPRGAFGDNLLIGKRENK